MYRVERLPYNKYKAKSSVYNGVSYHSKLEANYAQELDLRVYAKDIVRWERQVKIEINFKLVKKQWILTGEAGLDLKSKNIQFRHFRNYFIDFVVYHNDKSIEYTECKGMETEVWKMKWFLSELIFKDHPKINLLIVK